MTNEQRRKYRDALAGASGYANRVVADFSAPEQLAWCAYHSVETPAHYTRRRVRDDVRRLAGLFSRTKGYVNRVTLVPGDHVVTIAGYRVSNKRTRAALWRPVPGSPSCPGDEHPLRAAVCMFEAAPRTGRGAAWLFTAAGVHGGTWVRHIDMWTRPGAVDPLHEMRNLICRADPAAAALLLGPAVTALDAWEAVRSVGGAAVDAAQAAARREIEEQAANWWDL